MRLPRAAFPTATLALAALYLAAGPAGAQGGDAGGGAGTGAPVAQAPLEAERPPWDLAVFPSGSEFALELAVSLEERALGYMFRERVGPHEGMLFVFPGDGPHGFWMRNCVVPLDLIWIDRDRRVVHVVRDAQPCPDDGECPTIEPLRNARYVLEVAAGTVEREGLELGDRLLFVDLDGDG